MKPQATGGVLLLVLMAIALSGCSLIKKTLELPDKAVQAIMSLNAEKERVDPVELQSQLIRFSDHYLDAMNSTSSQLRQGEDKLPERRSLLNRRISITDDVLAIATGSNAYANLLDMVILVTLNRMNVQDYWMPKRYGNSARPMLEAAQASEKEIWRLASTALKMEQIEELRTGINVWHGQFPEGQSPRDVGALGFASEIAKMNTANRQDSTSVFNLLMIDPFAGLDPATSELANTRLFAERGLFLARHMPTLMRWETELLAIQTSEIPQVDRLLSASDQLSLAADRFSQTTATLPALFSSEREHIVDAINSQRPGLLSLAGQSEKTLNAGKQMSEATNAALKTFQGLVRQLEESPSNPNSEPFRINDYTKSATEIQATAEKLQNLLLAFDQTIKPERLDAFSARAELLSRQALASSKTVVDYAYTKILRLGVILIALTCSMFLLTSLAFWMLKKKLVKP